MVLYFYRLLKILLLQMKSLMELLGLLQFLGLLLLLGVCPAYERVCTP